MPYLEGAVVLQKRRESDIIHEVWFLMSPKSTGRDSAAVRYGKDNFRLQKEETKHDLASVCFR